MPPPRPYTLVAELSYRCPLRCPYCSNPVDIGADRYRAELEGEHWMRVFHEARALGVLQLALTGGEPMLRGDLDELVAAGRAAGLYSTLVTGATLFTRERAERLKEAGLDHVQVSIQSPDPKENDRIAGNRSFEKKIAAARATREVGFPLTINCVLHRQNLDRIEEILRLGGRQPAGAAADARAARARRGSGRAVPRARRPEDHGPLGPAGLLRGPPEAVHGRLGAHHDGRRPERRRASVSGGDDDSRPRVPQRSRSPTPLDLA